MAATAMDPVDIANILAQELLYQQVIAKKHSIETRRPRNISPRVRKNKSQSSSSTAAARSA